MNEGLAIKVEQVSKVFSLRQSTTDAQGNVKTEHWALKDVSFEIKKGESVGIIGPNGSGKSTLLKILAGITKPSSGSVTIRGKVASILDIGAGFHPELSGRENVYLNGQIHGFSKKEIENKFDEIVAFSGISNFIDEPVKNYSNGMYLRLAFSIMAHFDFDVYLFDEVLSVGDAEFNIKSNEKIQELAQTKTMIFVSHNLKELSNSSKFIVLKNGVLDSNPSNGDIYVDYLATTIQHTNRKIYSQNVTLEDFSDSMQSKHVTLKRFTLQQVGNEHEFRSDEEFNLSLSLEKHTTSYYIDPLISISDFQGNIILTTAPFLSDHCESNLLDKEIVYTCNIPKHLFNSQIFSISLIVYGSSTPLRDKLINHQEINTSKTLNEVNDVIGNIVFSIPNILMFRPVFVHKDKVVNFSDINIRSSLIPYFKWHKK